MPDYWDWHQKDPNVGNQVRDIREISECNQVKAITFHCTIPECFNRSTRKRQGDSNSDSPRNDECRSCQYDFSKKRYCEDAVVEGEDTQLDRYQCNIVEVRKYVVSLHRNQS